MRSFPFAALALLAGGCLGPTGEVPAGPGGEAGQPPPPMGAGDGGQGAAGAPTAATGFGVAPGEGVLLTGSLAYDGTRTGTIRIDFLTADPDAAMPGAVHTLVLDAPGPWSVEAPRDFGRLQICAFLDENGDGPSPGEPKVMLDEPLTVASTPIADLALVVRDDWDDVHMKTPPGTAAPAPAGGDGVPADGAAPGAPASDPAQPAGEAPLPPSVGGAGGA